MRVATIAAAFAATLASSCGLFDPCAGVECELCAPPLSITIESPSGPMPQVEIRGVTMECVAGQAAAQCTTSAAQDVYEFEIIADGYETIHVRHEVSRPPPDRACCCCCDSAARLSFQLQPRACAREPISCCTNGCGDTTTELAVCDKGVWTCASGVPQTTCIGGDCSGAGTTSTLRRCADYDAGVCFNNCPAEEVCFTQLACGPPSGNDGGSLYCPSVGSGDAGLGDNRCHRRCQAGCGSGETCQPGIFYGCSDYAAYMGVCR